MDDQISLLLREYGFETKEIKVLRYLFTVEKATAYGVYQNTDIHKTTAYGILDKLVKSGFINKSIIENTAYYYVNDISSLLTKLKDKYSILSELKEQIKTLGENIYEPNIRILEGISGQKVFNNTLFTVLDKDHEYCYVIGNTPTISTSSQLLIKNLLKELKTKKIDQIMDYKTIWDNKYSGYIEELKELREFGKHKFLTLPETGMTTIIYSSYVAFLYTSDKPYVLEIKNDIIAKEIKSLFEHLWEAAKKK